MWLLDTKTFMLKFFMNETKQKYAILSHRWGEMGEEAHFNDMQVENKYYEVSQLTLMERYPQRYVKIKQACTQARIDLYDYIWIDTCCINRESSAELSEAINSMYRWYSAADECYVYLADTELLESEGNGVPPTMKNSEWFKRGWTLQELIAPKTIKFFDRNWQSLGTKHELKALIYQWTGISIGILIHLDGVTLAQFSIAHRMSWASKRVTTLPEDMAYCLLGIFNVNMSLIYGEGENAFLRLQTELIAKSDDQTIFAWPMITPSRHGLLADHPRAFRQCQATRCADSFRRSSPYSLTNRGLFMKLKAIPWRANIYIIVLNCSNEGLPTFLNDEVEIKDMGPNRVVTELYRIGVFLARSEMNDDQYVRVIDEGLSLLQLSVAEDTKTLEFYAVPDNIRQNFASKRNWERRKFKLPGVMTYAHGFRFKSPYLIRGKYKLDNFKLDDDTGILTMKPYCMEGTIDIRQQECEIKVIKLGFDFDFNPVCFIAAEGGLSNARIIDPDIPHIASSPPSPEDVTQWQSIYERSSHDAFGWSSFTEIHHVNQLAQHPGLWAIKGDRLHNMACPMSGVVDDFVLWMTKPTFNEEQIWTVSLSGQPKFNPVLAEMRARLAQSQSMNSTLKQV